MKSFLLLLLSLYLFAQENYSIKIAYGKVTSSDLGEILMADIQEHKDNLKVLAIDTSYLLKRDIYNLPIDITLNLGGSCFNEDNTHNNIYETVLYIKAYYKFNTLNSRFGFGEGLSYTSDVLITEYLEATQKKDHYSQFLNYLDISLDFDFGKLMSYKPLYFTYLGVTIKHRSGIFGLINNVSHGGSNYNTFYIERKF
ncbi:MAG: hypothetical protein U9P38_09170 [Campylobacterota bacterium]|nr:hypothetical protein [Campylobacterota bacterium]